MRTWPPWVWPESVSETRAGTRGKMSGSCASRITGASSRDLGQRAIEIVHALETARAALAAAVDEGQLVAEAGEPETAAVLDEAHDVVLVDGDALALEHAPAEHGALARALRGDDRPTSRGCRGWRARRAAPSVRRAPRPIPPAATERVLNLWLAAKSPSSTMMSGVSELVCSTISRMRSAGMAGPPACTSAMTPIESFMSRGQLGGDTR